MLEYRFTYALAGVHHDEPVNFRGKGCPRCPTRKANKCKATEPSDDNYEKEQYR